MKTRAFPDGAVSAGERSDASQRQAFPDGAVKAIFLVLFYTATLAGCASGQLWGEPARGEPKPRPPEPVALSASPQMGEARTPASEGPAWPQHEDGLSLKSTEFYPDFGIGDVAFRTDQQAGLAGDKDAAVRVARMFQRGTNGAPRDEKKMVQWLRRASEGCSHASSATPS